jgi:hypothetical protein
MAKFVDRIGRIRFCSASYSPLLCSDDSRMSALLVLRSRLWMGRPKKELTLRIRGSSSFGGGGRAGAVAGRSYSSATSASSSCGRWFNLKVDAPAMVEFVQLVTRDFAVLTWLLLEFFCAGEYTGRTLEESDCSSVNLSAFAIEWAPLATSTAEVLASRS